MRNETANPARMKSYQQAVADVLAALDTDERTGLSQGRAQERLGRYAGMSWPRKSRSRMAEIYQPVHRCACDPALRRGFGFRGAMAV